MVAERRSFLLRIDPMVLDAVQRWANDDLRSLNAQIEYLLRQSLQRAGRLKPVIDIANQAEMHQTPSPSDADPTGEPPTSAFPTE